jgi:hypothetical protein
MDSNTNDSVFGRHVKMTDELSMITARESPGPDLGLLKGKTFQVFFLWNSKCFVSMFKSRFW